MDFLSNRKIRLGYWQPNEFLSFISNSPKAIHSLNFERKESMEE